MVLHIKQEQGQNVVEQPQQEKEVEEMYKMQDQQTIQNIPPIHPMQQIQPVQQPYNQQYNQQHRYHTTLPISTMDVPMPHITPGIEKQHIKIPEINRHKNQQKINSNRDLPPLPTLAQVLFDVNELQTASPTSLSSKYLLSSSENMGKSDMPLKSSQSAKIEEQQQQQQILPQLSQIPQIPMIPQMPEIPQLSQLPPSIQPIETVPEINQIKQIQEPLQPESKPEESTKQRNIQDTQQIQQKHGQACGFKDNKGNSSFVSKDALDDGYHWHKYGQKLLRGSKFPTCYYRCAHLGCAARRQVSRDPTTNEIVSSYIGVHNHPKPQLVTAEAETQEELQRIVARGQLFVWTDAYGTKNIYDGYNEVPYEDLEQQIRRPTNLVIPDLSTIDFSDMKSIEGMVDMHYDGINTNVGEENKPVLLSNISADGVREIAIKIGTNVRPQNDGFQWTKYGQKKPNINGSSGSVQKLYLKCILDGCQAKKLVQAATTSVLNISNPADNSKNPSEAPGIGTSIIYKGIHNHSPDLVKVLR